MSSWVNPKIVIGDAGPKGRGLFARENIKKGEVVMIMQGKIIYAPLNTPPPKEVSKDLWFNVCIGIETEFGLCPDESDVARREGVFMMNHSCNPNCGLRGQIVFVAMRDIEPQEELTYDYAMTDNNFDYMGGGKVSPMKCVCGSPHCRGFFTGEDWKRKDLQEKYKGYFSSYIQEMIDEMNKKS